MTTEETRFIRAVDEWTSGMPDYQRGVASVLALAAYRLGKRSVRGSAQTEPRARADEIVAGGPAR